MATPGPLRSPSREPIPIDARAAEHLRYIRETMESAAEFTAVPGWGGVAMGITALAAAFFASRQTTPRAWLTVWLIEAFVAVAIAAPTAATKAHRANSALFSGPGRKFVLSFAPPIVVGGLLTFALFQARSEEHTSELQSPCNLVCRLLLEKKKKINRHLFNIYKSLDCHCVTAV